MKFLRELKPEEINGKRFLVRLDLNVPVENGKVMDDFRIVSSLETLNFIQQNGGKIIVIAHCEANKGESCNLDAATEELKKHISDIEVRPNLRKHAGEKENSETFAQELAALGDIYVNDAFSVSHREHASIVGVPKLLPSYAGFQLEKEIKNLEKAFSPSNPFVFILGGAKFETKIPLIEKFLDKADTVFIGGALANDLLKASGMDVKNSIVSKDSSEFADTFKNILAHPKVIQTTDVIWNESNDMIYDIGMNTVEKVCEKIKDAKFVIWNGPLGYTEAGFDKATLRIAQAITESGAESIIGGGDTLAALKDSGYLDKFTFVSTGGGATLDFLANGTLPGIEALG